MKTYTVMVVDDSALARLLLAEALSADPSIEVPYAAPSATLGIEYLAKNGGRVDLVLLDVEMPHVDGIEALRRIREKWPALPVLMCSSLTARGAEVTLRALSEGASDYICKPTAAYPKDRFARELLEKVHVLVQREAPIAAPAVAVRRIPRSHAPALTISSETQAVAIGCSTGGPGALARLFATLYRPLRAPMFIVQHMPPLFTKLLAERLSVQSGQVVKEAEHAEQVAPGVCYVAPGGHHMTVVRKGVQVQIELNDDPPENFCRPAVDVLFRGLARVYGGNVLAAVLTGMGHDGARGASELVTVGGRVMVQDPESCVVPSMPNAVISAGAAQKIMTIEDIGREFDASTSAARPNAAGGTI